MVFVVQNIVGYHVKHPVAITVWSFDRNVTFLFSVGSGNTMLFLLNAILVGKHDVNRFTDKI